MRSPAGDALTPRNSGAATGRLRGSHALGMCAVACGVPPRCGHRAGDAAPMAIVQLMDQPEKVQEAAAE